MLLRGLSTERQSCWQLWQVTNICNRQGYERQSDHPKVPGVPWEQHALLIHMKHLTYHILWYFPTPYGLDITPPKACPLKCPGIQRPMFRLPLETPYHLSNILQQHQVHHPLPWMIPVLLSFLQTLRQPTSTTGWSPSPSLSLDLIAMSGCPPGSLRLHGSQGADASGPSSSQPHMG